MPTLLPLAILLQSTTATPAVPTAADTPAPVEDMAQATPGPVSASPAARGDGGEILVTARRREESAQAVPIAITVTSGEALNATGAYNLGRLQTQQPAVQFYSSNPRNSAINIRGLGAPFGLTNDGIEQGVGFYVDQVYIGRVGAATFDFVDVERLEVLRGPQGTLYGKNTTAGAVNISTRKPSFTPEARVEASYGNYGFVQVKGTASAPIADGTLAARLSASMSRRDGTIRNVATGEDLHRQDNVGLRGQLLWLPTQGVDVTFVGDFNLQNPKCCVQYFARTGATQRPLSRQYAALARAFGYAPPSVDPFDRVTDLDAQINSRQEIGGASAVVNWDVGAATLTSVSAWRYWNWLPANDRDFTGLPITTVSQNPSRQTQVSQEFRLSSNGRNRLDYTVGAFLFHQKIDTDGSQVQGAAASRWLLNPGTVPSGNPAGCATATTAACNPAVLDGLTSTNTIRFDNTSFAVFGKVNWQPVEGVHVNPGLRVNYDRKKGSYLAVVTTGSGSTVLNNDQLGVLAPQSYAPEFSDWNVSGDVTLSYDVSRDVHAYATYARSFKSGGINLSGLPLNATNTAVDLTTQRVKPEKVDHVEFGLKTQFWDRRATFNLAGFWTEIRDYQATVSNGQTTVIRGYLANADKVRVRGVEWDSSLRPVDGLSIYFNGALTDAKYARFRNAPCPPELSGGNPALNGATPAPAGTPGLSPLVCDVSGQILPGISKWALSWGGEYAAPATALGAAGEIYVGYEGSWRSKFSSNPSRSLYTDIDGYSLSNLRAGYRVRDGINVFGWVRNLFGTRYFELLTVASGSTGLIVGQPGDPRTYGMTVSKRF